MQQHLTQLAQDLRAVLDTRFSCRGYLAHEVPAETIQAILSTAQRTASWCNSQPWQVIVTRPKATQRLRDALQLAQPLPSEQWDIRPPIEYRGVYRDRRRACGWQLYDSVGVKAGDRQASARQAFENFRFFGAPHVALITTEAPLGTYGVLDCGAYVNSFMLAATSLGVATVAQAALASMAHVLRANLPIPADRLIVCGIAFGYEDKSHPANTFRTARATLEETVTFVDA